MVLLVLEEKLFKINNFSVEVEEKFPKLSRRYIDKDNYSKTLKELSEPPLLTEKWFVKIGSKTPINVIEELAINDLVIGLASFTKRETLRDIADYLTEKNIKFKYYDAINITNEQVIKYLKEHLDISTHLAGKICDGCRGNTRLIQENVLALSSFSPVTELHLKNYMIKASEISFRYFMLAILGYRFNTRFNYKGTIKFLHSRRYAFKFIIRFLTKEINTVINLFECIDTGELRYSNINHFLKVNSKRFRNVSPYYVENILELRTYTSIDYLFVLKDIIANIPVNKIAFVYFINLVKIGQPGGKG